MEYPSGLELVSRASAPVGTRIDVDSLASPAVLIWWIDLRRSDDEVATNARLLDPEEDMKASRFRHERDRRRYIVAHASLRVVLGRQVGAPPTSIRLRTTPSGKPHLLQPESDVAFSLSHDGDVAVIALTRLASVGVDVALARPWRDVEAVVSAAFSPREAKALRSLVGAARELAFARVWARKEAVLKASGVGLGSDLRTLEVGPILLTKPGSTRVTHCDDWLNVYDLPMRDVAVAAVAVPAYGAVLVERTLTRV